MDQTTIETLSPIRLAPVSSEEDRRMAAIDNYAGDPQEINPEVVGFGSDPILLPRDGFLRPTVQRRYSWSVIIRCIVGVVLFSCITYVVFDFCGDRIIESKLEEFLEWTRTHTYEGMIAVILCYIVATVCFVPGSILTFGAGYAIGSSINNTFVGVVLASACVFIGASIGSICSFLLGRYLFRDCVLQLAYSYPIFQAVERALETNGIKIMVLLRLSPLIPYNALDYVSGVTSIPLRDYSIALVAILPGAIMLCFLGASASSLSDRTSSTSTGVKVITILSGLLFGGGGVFMASYYSKLELDRILAIEATNHSTIYTDRSLSYDDADDQVVEEYQDEAPISGGGDSTAELT